MKVYLHAAMDININSTLYEELSDIIYYDGSEKILTLVNTLGINEEDYTISYYSLDKDGNYVLLDSNPVKIGDYKVVLTYEEHVIEAVYSIVEKPVNPSTGIFTPYIISGLVIGMAIVGISFYRKKKFM